MIRMPQGYYLLSKEKNTDLSNKLAFFKRFLAFIPSSDDNLAEEIIKEKIRLQKASLVQIINLITEREIAKQNNLASIESEMMKVQGELFLYKCIVYPINPDNKRKSNLERAISELENQRRQEEIDCWKDTLELWQELLKIAAEYRATVRRVKMIALPLAVERETCKAEDTLY